MIRAPKYKALRDTALIGHVLTPDLSELVVEATREAYATLSQEEWRELFGLADRRMVLPGWFLGLRARNILPLMPALLQDAAEAAWLLNVERNKSLVREARYVSSLLAEIECPTVYLKGMGHILSGTHGDIGARMTGDLDVLVPRNRVQDAARHLHRHGGEFYGGIPFEVGVEPCLMSHHLPPMQMKEGIGAIELHSAFVTRRAIWPSAGDILKEAIVPGQDPSILAPRPDHAIALSIAHSLSRPVALPGAEIHLKDLWDVTALSRSPGN